MQSFLTEFNATNGKAIRAVDQDAMYLLERYPWPGNIRELRNVIERATILAESEFIEPKHLPPTLIARGEESLPTMTISPGTTVDEAERRLILLTLDHTRNNKTRAAEILGISLKTLHNKLNRMKEEGMRTRSLGPTGPERRQPKARELCQSKRSRSPASPRWSWSSSPC